MSTGTSPEFQAIHFFHALERVPGWQSLPLTQAAQAVQRSAFPNAYASWEEPAGALFRELHPNDMGSAISLLHDSSGSARCWIGGKDGQPGDSVPLPSSFTLPADTPPAAAIAVTWALAQLGTPYSYGGDCTAAHSGDPSRQCDCSSLVQQAFLAAGISLPRTTTEQEHAGIAVPTLDQLRPGDLLFMPGSSGSTAAPGHVGMFIGAGLLVQAPNTGDRVKTTPLSAWADSISAVRRMTSTRSAPTP